MEVFNLLLQGFGVALQPMNLLYVFIGCAAGTIVGVLPGLGPVTALALLLPITFGMNPTSAMIMLAGIYYGSMYGGSITSTLLHTPGESASVVTMLDGYPLTQQGRGAAALGMQAFASFIGGTLSIVLLMMMAPMLADYAVQFGPAEYTVLMAAGLSLIAALAGKYVVKAFASAIIGLMLATIGSDVLTGESRYTFGQLDLLNGLKFLIVAIGVFAIAEVLISMTDVGAKRVATPYKSLMELFPTREDWCRSFWPIIRSSFLGFFVGVLPGAGATIASFLSYGTEKRLSKEPERFGKGAMEGVAAPEAANNAATGGAMVPLLTLGIPGSNATAVMLTALMMFGLQPGPLMFKQQPELVWGLIASMYIGNIVLLILNVPLVGVFIQILRLPVQSLYALIIVLSVIGTYSEQQAMFDVSLMVGFGVMGYLFRWLSFPLPPLILGLVLGPMFERNLRRALTISDGDWTIFFTRPLSLGVITLAALVFLTPAIHKAFHKRRRSASTV
jgi:putative tricarboxylic transport membrane protein